MRKILLVFFAVAVLLSVNGMAALGDIQVILKSQSLGLDKSYGVYVANVTITMNKIGNVTYRENYYYTDYSYSTPQETFFRSSSYDVVMKDYAVSFIVKRPGQKYERDSWNTIKAVVLLDKKIVYEVTMPGQSGTYKSFTTGKMTFTNDSTMQIGKTRPIIEKKPSIFVTPNASNSTEKVNDTGEDNTDKAKQSPMVGAAIVIAIILSVYIFTRRSGKNKN